MTTMIRTKATVSFFVLAIAISGSGSGCARKSENTITLAGSTAFQPFAEKLAEQYLETHTDVRVNVQGGGSSRLRSLGVHKSAWLTFSRFRRRPRH